MTTLIYKGTLSSVEDISKVITSVQQIACSMNWTIYSQDERGIAVVPHLQCEAIVLDFDRKLTCTGATKTVYAPEEVHAQIIEMFYMIKPLFRRLKIEDETGYWDAYLESKSGKPIPRIETFPLTEDQQKLISPLLVPPEALDVDRDFWTLTPDSFYYRLEYLLRLPTIRDKLGSDLTHHNGAAYLARDMILDFKKEWPENDDYGFSSYKHKMYQSSQKYFLDLATLWAWHTSKTKPNRIKKSRCVNFSYALEKACFGVEDGYISKMHRDASVALDELYEQEGHTSPTRSLEILYGLLRFCKLG